MKRLSISIIFLVLHLFICIDASSQNQEKKSYKTVLISNAPVIDGLLNDEAWLKGSWESGFTQNEPFNGADPTQRTEFKIIYDENNLYVALKAYDDSPDSIAQRLTRRDQLDGDGMGLIIDSYHDLRTGFLFSVSAGGVKFDQVMSEDGDNEDQSWDPNWWVKVNINEKGWVAEMKIPFSQLRFEKASDIWGLQVFRDYYREDELNFWQHIPKDSRGLIHQFGEIRSMKAIRPKKIFDITPYSVVKAETYEKVAGNPFADGRDAKLNVGVDAKIGISNNFTLDMSINPDFGQVEADPSQVNLSAYEIFFEEKRPFFIEGANITNFGIGIGDGGIGNDNLFYSRRIGRRPTLHPSLNSGEYASIPQFTSIIGATKLTGKTSNGLSVGIIESITAREMAEIDSDGKRETQIVEPLTNYFVGRVQKDFNQGNTLIGGMLTSTNRDLDDYTNDHFHKSAYSGGLDFTKFWNDKTWMFNVNAAFSQVSGSAQALESTQRSSVRFFHRPDNDYVRFDSTRTSLAGSGGRMQLLHQKGHWSAIAVLLWKTPGFELNDIGFLRQADQLFSLIWAQYRVWEPKYFYRSFNISANHYRIWDFGGNRLGDGLELNGNINLKNYWYMNLGSNLNLNGISNSILRGGPRMKTPGSYNVRSFIRTDRRKNFSFNFSAGMGRGFESNSSNWRVNTGIDFRPTNTFTLSINPGYNTSFNELQYITQKDYNGDDRYIFGSIDFKRASVSLRISYNITPDLTLQYWGQPFIASGKYSDLKYISSPMASEYEDRFVTYPDDQLNLEDDEIMIDEDGNGTVDYTLSKPDFTVQEFLSNFVVRWEYSPGSVFYIVWNQTRNGYNDSGDLRLENDLDNLFTSNSHDIFLLKFSYRIGV